MKQSNALEVLLKHNIVLESFRGRTLYSFIDGSRTTTLIEVLEALSGGLMPYHTPVARTEIDAEIRRRKWSADKDAAAYVAKNPLLK